MRLGVIARADYTGLGYQTSDFISAMGADKALIINMSPIHDRFRLNDGTVEQIQRTADESRILHLQGWPHPSQHPVNLERELIEWFLADLDIIYTVETPYYYWLFADAERRGIKTVLHYNYEYLDYCASPQLPRPTEFWSPCSDWGIHTDRLRSADINPYVMPVPIQPPDPGVVREGAVNFYHCAGNYMPEDRNGTELVLEAWRHVKSDARLRITSFFKPKDHVERVLWTQASANRWVHFRTSDVLLFPRRFGGLCMPLLEAMACGMVPVMSDCPPNRGVLRGDERFLVPAYRDSTLWVKNPVDTYGVDPFDLARHIDWLVEHPQEVQEASQRALEIAQERSWDVWREKYRHALERAAGAL